MSRRPGPRLHRFLEPGARAAQARHNRAGRGLAGPVAAYLTWRFALLTGAFGLCLMLGLSTLPGLFAAFVLSAVAAAFLLGDRRAAVSEALSARAGRRRIPSGEGH